MGFFNEFWVITGGFKKVIPDVLPQQGKVLSPTLLW